MSSPSTSLSLTFRSTLLRVSLAAWTGDFWKVAEVENAALAALGAEFVTPVTTPLGTEKVITRRAAASVRKDIVDGWLCVLSQLWYKVSWLAVWLFGWLVGWLVCCISGR